MSNNKQSSVEWLSEIIRFANKELYAEMFDEIEQAKAMHRVEIIESYASGSNDRLRNTINTNYYNETFNNND